MTDRPIIFSAPMVRALLAGTKTQTRRVLKPKNHNTHLQCTGRGDWFWWTPGTGAPHVRQPMRYAPGDRLYVREAWRPHYLGDGNWNLDVTYPADGARRRINDGEFGDRDWRWPKAADRGNVTPLHMPRWASRITLTVTDVRVQRLQDISEVDAIDEGCRPFFDETDPQIMNGPNGTEHKMMPLKGPLDAFCNLWNSIHGPDAWDADPWVAAISFTVQHGNIDGGNG